MRLKQLFRFPEPALLLSTLVVPIVVGNTSIDIQFHDTLYVIGGKSWSASPLLMPFGLFLFLSWLSHLLLRKGNLLVGIWRWIQVELSLICIITIIVDAQSMHQIGLGPGSMYKYNFLSTLLLLSVLVFILCQLAFWINTTILLVMYKRPRSRTST